MIGFRLLSFAVVLLLLAGSIGTPLAYAKSFDPLTLLQEPVPVTDRWTEYSRVHQLPDGSFSMRSHVGKINYLASDGTFQKIDTADTSPRTDSFSAQWDALPMHVKMADDSSRCIFPDRNDLSYQLCLGKPFTEMGTPVKTGNTWAWDFPDLTMTVTVRATTVGLSFLLKNSKAPTSFTTSLTGAGVTRQGNEIIHNTVVVALLEPPVAFDANDVERTLTMSFPDGGVTISLDTTGLTFPIDIDPTIDVDLTTSQDDWFVQGAVFSNSDQSVECGAASGGVREIGLRFTGISGLDGADVTSADVNWSTRSSELNSMIARIYLNDVESPINATSVATHDALVRTTNFITFESYTFVSDGEHMGSAIDILALVEELVETSGFDPDAITVLCDDNGSSQSENSYGRFRSTNRSAATDPNLLIVYTEPTGVTFWFFFFSIMTSLVASRYPVR